jgi:protocatechuate 3,4-dioxygenase beta subunit
VLTDADGRFFFADLSPGRYSLTATKPGWIAGAFGRRRPGGSAQPIDLAENGRRGDATIPLWRYAVVSGHVMAADGDPLVGTDVRIFQQSFAAGRRQWAFTARAITDDRGVYRFASLMPGDYVVVVPATVTSEPPQMRAQSETPHAYLQTMTAVGSAPMSFERADVPTGDSRPLVSSPLDLPRPPSADAAWTTYVTTFFPSAEAIGAASTIHAESGHDRAEVDVVVRLAATYQVSGVVTSPDGTPAGFHAVHLLPADSAESPLFDAGTAVTDAAGAFTFYGVPPGQYVARVVRTPWPAGQGGRLAICGGTGAIKFVCSISGGPSSGPPPLPTEPLLYADQAVAVGDRNLRDVSIALRTGARVTGHVEYEGAAARPTDAQLSQVLVLFERAGGQTGQAAGGFDVGRPGRFSADGQFTTASTWPGRYVIRVSGAPSGWTFKGATFQGRDMSETPVDLSRDLADVVITFTDHTGKIEGTVQALDGQPDAGAAVLLFPTDRAGWTDYGRTSRRVRSTSAPAGKFTLPAPPPGEYFLIAVPDEQSADWQNPAFLEKLTVFAERVDVTDGASLTRALKTRRLQ